MQKKTFLFAGILLCLLTVAAGFYWYQKPRAGVANAKPDYVMSAQELYTAFEQDELTANSMFIEKVVQVKGTVDNVQATDSTINILLSAGNETGGVNCIISKANNMLPSAPARGSVIQIKGRCIGFLMDVNLTDAVIEK